MKCDVVKMRGESGKLEIEIPNFRAGSGSLVGIFQDCAQSQIAKTVALEEKITPHDDGDHQDANNRETSSDNLLPSHNSISRKPDLE